MHRIKPHNPPLVRAPVNSFEFQSCDRTSPGESLNALATTLHTKLYTTSSDHRLQLRLQGYLILFAPLAFVSECQSCSSKVPSQLVFFPISTYFTTPPGIPLTSPILKITSFFCRFWVKPKDLTKDLNINLQTLYAQ